MKASLAGNHADLGDLAVHNREFQNEYRLIQMTRDDAYGRVNDPLQASFFSPAYGNVTDKFGITFRILTKGRQ